MTDAPEAQETAGEVARAVERVAAYLDREGRNPWPSDLRTILSRLAVLEEERRLLSWQSMDTAPRDRMIIAMARYPNATAGSPSFVGWGGDLGWCEYSRHAPEPMVCWAWIDREVLPEWPAETAT